MNAESTLPAPSRRRAGLLRSSRLGRRLVRAALALSVAAAAASAIAGCNADSAMKAATQGPQANNATDAGAAPAVVADAAPPAPPPPPPMEFGENDFVESDRNRDPFRSYLSILGPDPNRKTAPIQRLVVLPQYSLDELQLIAIVTGGEYPRAMVLDPGKKGWVIKRGDWVGRPEVVHIGGANGADYQINWRVDKVRDGDVVFTREDPAQPGIPPASRVIALRPEGDKEAREKL